MRSMFETNLRTSGKEFTVERTGDTIIGIIIYDQNCIDCPNGIDVIVGDIFLSESGSHHQVTEIRSMVAYSRYMYKLA